MRTPGLRRRTTHSPSGVRVGTVSCFAVRWFHAGPIRVFTDSLFPLLQVRECHRAYEVVEQVFADPEDSAPANLPSGQFTANAAWLALAALARHPTRALGALAWASTWTAPSACRGA